MKGCDKDKRTLQSHAVPPLFAMLAKQQCSAPDWDLEKTHCKELRDVDAGPGEFPRQRTTAGGTGVMSPMQTPKMAPQHT